MRHKRKTHAATKRRKNINRERARSISRPVLPSSEPLCQRDIGAYIRTGCRHILSETNDRPQPVTGKPDPRFDTRPEPAKWPLAANNRRPPSDPYKATTPRVALQIDDRTTPQFFRKRSV